MPKVSSAALVALLSAPLLSAAVPPVERIEGESISEEDPNYYLKNLYLSEDNPFAPASEGDDDLGEQVILRRQSGRSPVRFRADTYLFWSNNTGSTAIDEDDGWYYGGSITARWKQRLTDYLSLDTYAYQDAFFYDSDGLDFQSSEFGLGLIADLPALDDLTIYGRYEFLYVHSDNPLFGLFDRNEHLSNRYHRLRLGAYKALYSKPSHLLSLSANGRWDFDASSGAQRRQQLSARLAYTWSVTGRLRTTAYYRASFRDYLASDRQDVNQYVGLEVNYTLTEWAEIYGSILYGVNDSNGGGGSRDYEALQGGVGLGLRASF